MPLKLSPILMESISKHAEKDYPSECCGFLVGNTQSQDANPASLMTAAQAVPADNTRVDSPQNRFEIDPRQMLHADRAARAQGLSVIGFYHSHPDAPARPSEFDREQAWPGYCYVIISVVQGRSQETRNWVLRDDRTRFEEDEII